MRLLPSLLALVCTLPVQSFATTITALNMSNFTVDQYQDFTATSAWDTTLWSNIYGTGFWLSDSTPDGLWITSSQTTSPEWQQSGIMQIPSGCSAGFGYGLFHWRARAGQLTQGPGINLIMWRADDDWIDSKLVNSDGTGYDTEIDALESWDDAGTPIGTTHSYGTAVDTNASVSHTMTFPTGNITAMHDYDIDWEAGTLTEYIDGVAQWQQTGEIVPKDYAHGGCNETLGSQVVIQTTSEPLPTVQLMLANSGHYLVNPAVTITSLMLRMLSGTFVLKGTLSGSTQTLAWDADGLYQGVLSTNQTTGSWSKLLNIPVGTSRGTHVITVYEVAHPTVKASYTVTY